MRNRAALTCPGPLPLLRVGRSPLEGDTSAPAQSGVFCCQSLNMARGLPPGQNRSTLLKMAEECERLADQCERLADQREQATLI
jgi:hypothetical protein